MKTLEEVKAYVDEQMDIPDAEVSKVWVEGFVAGLNEAGAITGEELDELLAYIVTVNSTK